MAGQYDHVLSIHGCPAARQTQIFLGGKNTAVAEQLGAALSGAGFRVHVTAASHMYAGRLARNVCNRGRMGCGVQIELTQAIRESPALEDRVSAVVRQVLLAAQP